MEIHTNEIDFKEKVLEADLPVLVDFWAEWCGPCRMVAPVVEAVAKEYAGRLRVCKINVDHARRTARTYGIASIPTLAIFKKGKEIERFVGMLSRHQLKAAVGPHLNG